MLVSQSYHALSFLRLLSPRADNPIEAGWVNPQPGADFTQTWFKGDTLSISWEGWPSSSIDQFLTTNVANLWITSFYDDHSPFTLLLTTNVNVSRAGSFDWIVDGSSIDSAMAERTEFVLRFLPPGDTFTAGSTDVQLYSAGIYLLATSSSSLGSLSSSNPSTNPPVPSSTSSSSQTSPSPPSSSSTSSSSTSSSSVSQTSSSVASPSTSGTTTSNTSATSSATSSPPASQSSVAAVAADPTSKATLSSGLSTGAKLGIGVGCGIAGIAVLGVVYAFGRYRRNLPFTPSTQFSGALQRESFKPIPATELHGQASVNELLERDHRRYYAELPST